MREESRSLAHQWRENAMFATVSDDAAPVRRDHEIHGTSLSSAKASPMTQSCVTANLCEVRPSLRLQRCVSVAWTTRQRWQLTLFRSSVQLGKLRGCGASAHASLAKSLENLRLEFVYVSVFF